MITSTYDSFTIKVLLKRMETPPGEVTEREGPFSALFMVMKPPIIL